MNDPILTTSAIFGAVILLFFMFMTWKLEGMWFSPGSVFAFAFFCHAFIAPISMLENNNTTLLLATMGQVQVLSIICFACLMLGYFMGAAGAPRGHTGSNQTYALSAQGTNACAAALVLCVAINILYSVTSGAFMEGKGAMAYIADASFWGRIKTVATILILPLFLTLMVSAITFLGTRRKIFFAILSMVLLVIVVHSLLTFARHLIAQIILVALIYYNFRVAAIRAKHVGLTLVILFVVSLFSDIRVFGEGIANLTAEEIFGQLKLSLETNFDPIKFFLQIGGAIAGQDVFSRVVSLVPDQELFRYGATYVESLVGILSPRLLTGNYHDISTPAFWFKDVYAPYVVNHGFDFSMLSEAYLNFGLVMWLPYLALGFVLARVSFVIRRTQSQLILVVSILFIIALITGLRTDSNAMFKTMVMMPIPVYLLFKIARWKFSASSVKKWNAAS